jgi:hypothetical protein
MRNAFEMVPGNMPYIPNFSKIGTGVQKLLGDTYIQRAR